MTESRSRASMHRTALVACLGAALAACGGSGGSSSGGDPVVTPPAANTLTLSGVAATGAAIASGAVEVKCKSGTGTATTNASGSFTVTVADGSLPCIVKVTAANGSVLHSVADGTGSTATVNINPLTELVVAQAAGGTAAGLYASFDTAAQAKVSGTALTGAVAAVVTALQGVVDLAGVDPLKGAIVAGSGQGLDGKLDALAAALAAANLSVADVGAAIVANGSAAAGVINTQVRPAAATCASMHSGPYLLMNPNEVDAGRYRKATLNASALTLTFADGTVSTPATPVVGRPCQFSTNNNTESLVVSPAGVFVNRYIDGKGVARVLFGMPEQTIGLADLAGTWNSVEMGSGTPFKNGYAMVTINAAGAVTAGSDCPQLQPCTPWTNTPGAFSVNADGGYTYADAEGGGRFFAYRAPSGDLMMVGGGSGTGGLIVLGKQQALALPVVAASTPFWDISLNNQRVASALLDDTSTITAVDTAANTYTRSRSSDGRVDTFAINTPRAGLRYRAANSCKSSTGAAVSCSGTLMLPLKGMGMVVYGSPVVANDFFGISVNMPATSTTGAGGGTGSDPGTSAPANTLVVAGGESYPLRVTLAVNTAGQITGGSYDFHKLDGTMTPCEHSAANDATCHGASSGFGPITQGGPLSASGSATAVALSAAPDPFGTTFTGTITGTTWTGTVTKAATLASPETASGTFSVVVVIAQTN